MFQQQKGFTLIELILVVAIISLLGLSIIPFSSNLILRNNIQIKINEVYTYMKTAQLNSLLGKGNSRWGVQIDSTNIYLFKGDNFANRDLVFDQKINIPNSISITPVEIVFDKNTGELAQEYVISINSQLKNRSLSINRLGVINVN